MDRYPEKEFYNGYGPSEGTGMSTLYRVNKTPKDPGENVPIGKACANSEVLILRDDHSQVKISEIGEICIRGSGVSSGYWNNPQKTENCFITIPLSSRISDRVYKTGDLGMLREDGNIEFVGRKDQQVKWMGYRIELGEIESTLLSFREINDAVVLLTKNGDPEGEKELIGWIEGDNGIDADHTLDKLAMQLPHYMIPKRLIRVSVIPRSDRGKVDRLKLLEQFSKEEVK
jgi:acyl-CoA synthetase (AMP-forming)/AMP-acid ligase II